MTYALFCDKCNLGSFCNINIYPFTCKSCNQPERLNPEDIQPFDGILSPDWVVNLVNVCDSPTSENK